MEKIAASLLATAGIACAQTYNYDSSSETLVITGKGNTVADRITLEGPITPGSTVPGTSEIFGDTKEIILKDVWTSPDSIRIKYVEPTSEGNNTTLKLENSRLGVKLFHSLVDYATVYHDGRIVFQFRNGMEIETII